VVCFIYRPEYYGIKEDDDGKPTEGYAELIIEKCRNGRTGIVPLAWEAKRMEFVDPENSSQLSLTKKLFAAEDDLSFSPLSPDEQDIIPF